MLYALEIKQSRHTVLKETSFLSKNPKQNKWEMKAFATASVHIYLHIY